MCTPFHLKFTFAIYHLIKLPLKGKPFYYLQYIILGFPLRGSCRRRLTDEV